VVFLLTTNVVIGKVVAIEPAFTAMVAGTLAFVGLLLARDITIPPTGAGAVSVTVPVALDPPLTLEGFKVSEDRAGDGAGCTVKLVVFVTPA
jgi:hypothetical protein